jgi:hypothetical protein
MSTRTLLTGWFAVVFAAGAARVEFARDEAAAAMTRAAREFLAGLDETQRARAALAFEDPARKDWHFVPRARAGVELGALDAEDRARLDALLDTGLSLQGRAKFEGVLELEALLFAQESRPGAPAAHRDPAKYTAAIFGKPGEEPWGWRVEGHHWSASFTSADPSTIAVTPNFVGANPARVKQGPRAGNELLAWEEARARAKLA